MHSIPQLTYYTSQCLQTPTRQIQDQQQQSGWLEPVKRLLRRGTLPGHPGSSGDGAGLKAAGPRPSGGLQSGRAVMGGLGGLAAGLLLGSALGGDGFDTFGDEGLVTTLGDL